MTKPRVFLSCKWIGNRLIFAALVQVFSVFAYAGPQVGTVTSVQGQVDLLSHPGKSMEGATSARTPCTRACTTPWPGRPRGRPGGEKGNILRTQPGAKARVIYDNGDQFHVAPGTALSIKWDHDSGTAKAEMSLSYGGVRGVIAKGGPHSKFTIRTRTAVMGVRGTDFFIGVDRVTGATETATLRGSVAVASAATPDAVPVEVKAGEAASVAQPPPAPAAPSDDCRRRCQRASASGRAACCRGPQGDRRRAGRDPESVRGAASGRYEGYSRPAARNRAEDRPARGSGQSRDDEDIRQENPKLAEQLDKAPAADSASVDMLNNAVVAEGSSPTPRRPRAKPA